MVLLLPLLLLLTVVLAGSLRITATAQARAALQSRLDVCAVKLAVERKVTLARIAKTNAALRTGIVAIYVARGAMLAGPVGAAAGSTSQTILLRVNRALAFLQQGMLAEATAAENVNLKCAPGAYSRETALCISIPPISLALEREKTLFSDVSGPLMHRNKNSSYLARIRCSGAHGLATTITVRGDRSLVRSDFQDEYAP